MTTYITRRELPYHIRCYCCSTFVQVDEMADYGETVQCECGATKVQLVKPEPVSINTTIGRAVRCRECHDAITSDVQATKTCNCGLTTVTFNPPKLHTIFNTRSRYSWAVQVSDKINWNNVTSIKLRSSHNNRYSRDISDGDYILDICATERNDINGRIERAVVDICRAFVCGIRPRYKKGEDFFHIRDNVYCNTRIYYSMQDKTITLSDCNATLRLHWDSETNKFDRIDEYSVSGPNWVNTSYLRTIARAITDLWTDLKEPIDMASLNGKSWDGVMINSLDDLSIFDGHLAIRNHYYRYYIGARSRNFDRWHKRYQEEVGYMHDDVFCNKNSMLSKVFLYKRNSETAYALYKRAIEDPEILDSLYSSKLRIEGADDDQIRSQMVNLDRQHQENIISQAGRDRCVICGGKIHSLSAYNPIPTDKVLNDEKQRFGVLCCSCYNRYSDGLRQYKEKIIGAEKKNAKA